MKSEFFTILSYLALDIPMGSDFRFNVSKYEILEFE